MRRKIYALLFLTFMVFLMTGCTGALDEAKEAVDSYNTELSAYREKTDSYNKSAQAVIDANAALKAATDAAQAVIDQGEEPYDPATLDALKSAMAQAEDAKVADPQKCSEYEELTVDEDAGKDELKALKEDAETKTEEMKNAEVPEIPEVPDYTAVIEQVNTTLEAYEDSIQGLKQITAPSDEFVMERLKSVDTITEMDAVTEDHDPNGQLNKQGGYVGCIYFTDKQVDRDSLYLEGDEDIIDVGTDGGGAIEIFKTADEANVRNDYLGQFDGTGFASGSHYVYGTIIIRTSNELNGTKQQELTEKILKALLKVDK